MSSELKVPYNITFSTNARDTQHYPDTNRFVIHLPNTMKNVVGLSMQSMEMNLSQNLIRENVNDRLRFSEGLRLGSADATSTTFKIQVGSGDEQTVYLPSYLNPITAIATDGITDNKTFTLHRPLGVNNKATNLNEDNLTVQDFYFVGYKFGASAFPIVSFRYLLKEGKSISVSGDGKSVTINDAADLLVGLGSNEDGVTVSHCFIYTPPLSVDDVVQTMNSQLDSTVRVSQFASTFKLMLNYSSSLSCTISHEDISDAEQHALKSIGFDNHQQGRGGMVAKRRFPAFDAILPPGNYDISDMAKGISLAMNRGALKPVSHNGFFLKEMEENTQPKAVLVWQNEKGEFSHARIPDLAVFKSPYQLKMFLATLFGGDVTVDFISDSEHSTEHSLAGRFTFTCTGSNEIAFILSLRQISFYCGHKSIGDFDAEATLNLINLLGFEQDVMEAAPSVESSVLVRWPSHPRTWRPVYNDAGTITEASIPWLKTERMFPSLRYVLSTDKKRPSQLTFLTTQDIIVTNTFSFDGVDLGVHLENPTPYPITAALTATAGEPNLYVLRDGLENTLSILGYATEFDSTTHKSKALSDHTTSALFPDRCNIVPFGRYNRFGFHHHGVENSINYRLGISEEYPLDNRQIITQQFDLRPNHYFFVSVKNLGFFRSTNSVLIKSGNNQTYERHILARCVVSAPFVFDRGQSHAVSMSQPVNMNRLEIELLDEGGQNLFQTNKQEISFTFTFMCLVRP